MTNERKETLLFVGFGVAVVYAFCVTFCDIPKPNRETSSLILGVLIGACIKDTWNYLFGTSQNSQKKDETIANSQGLIEKALMSSPPSKTDENEKTNESN